MTEIFDKFQLVSDDIEKIVDSQHLLKEINENFAKDEFKPDVSMYSFYRRVKNAKTVSGFYNFDQITQKMIHNFMFTDDFEEYFSFMDREIDPVLLICNGIFAYEHQQTMEDVVFTVDELLSENDLDKFCSFYGVNEIKRMDKIKGIVEEQTKYFRRLKCLGIDHNIVNVLAF